MGCGAGFWLGLFGFMAVAGICRAIMYSSALKHKRKVVKSRGLTILTGEQINEDLDKALEDTDEN